MSFWLITAGYLFGAACCWRPFAMSVLIAHEEECPGLPIDSSDRFFAAFMATFAVLIWPVVLVVRQVWRIMKGRHVLLTPNEKAAAQRAELEALRRLAREHDLPLPDMDSRRSTG